MKKILYTLLFLLFITANILRSPVMAGTNIENDIGPIPCFGGACPPDLPSVYNAPTPTPDANGKINYPPHYAYSQDTCVSTYEQFLVDPAKLHFWAEDIEVTNQGKADERARQFIYWVITKPAIDNHAVIKAVWNTTRNISYFLVIIVAAVIGIGFIISQRTNFNLKIKVWPAIWKILLALLYITFSAAIILFLIQLSELMMKFFIETLGGKDLFNIYFSSSQSSESNYTYFYGCRDLNIRSQEGADTEMLMLQFTNITYYVMGTMLLLRKILLWFLLFVSPFLAILMPFVFIRNTGWIWIGVFFQWLFYGPLFALFLGALSKIWKAGIPFQFDFSRRGTPEGYIYPTAIRILYGGPAQRLSILNNANYIDTYVEYIITLLMLWAVTFFPWWLLRIFRDYCCDVFAAANNVLLSMYDQMRAGPIAPPPGPAGQTFKGPRSTAGTARDIPRGEGRTNVERPMAVRISSMTEIKQAKTQDILSSMNLYAPKLTDIAKFETNKESKSAVEKNLSMIANPVKAETPTERQQYMNIRTELFSRASKDDKLARGIISSTSTSFVEKEQQRQEILKNTPQAVPMSQAVSSTTQLSQDKVQSITNNILNSVVNNNTAISSIAQESKVSQEQVKSILNSYSQNMSQPTNQVMSNIAQSTNTTKEQVSEVLKQAMNVSDRSSVVSQTALSEKISNETVQKVLQTLPMAVTQQQSQVQNISVTANVPVEKAQSITNNIFNNVANNTKITNALAQSTNLSQEQVKSVLTSYTQNMSQPMSQAINTMSQQTSVSKEKIAEVLQKSNVVMQQSSMVNETASKEKTDAKTVEKVVSAVKESITAEAPAKVQTGVSVEKTQAITTSIFNNVINNQATMQTLQQETNLPANQLKNVLTTYSQNINQTPEVIAERISQSAGIEKTKVAPVLSKVMSSIKKDSFVPSSVINDIAKKQNVKVSDIKKVVDAQVPMVTEPDKHVEKSIAIPSSISLEDYEEVKKMWTSQYEKGEVPTTENIANREQWVDQDTVMITNTLNKLMSNDDTQRREGLDDLGYILPIFMINNLKGDEMLVYLKAKLEAAKTVKTQMIKVKEVQTQVVQPEEEFVDVDRSTSAANENVLHMEVEEEIQPEVRVTESTSYSSSNDDSSSFGDSFANIKVNAPRPVFTLNVNEIKTIKTNDLVRNLNMFAEKITDIARFDTNRQNRETVLKHVEYLANPSKATNETERQTYLDIRNELSSRGTDDRAAQQLIAPSKEQILKSVPRPMPAVNVVSNMVNLPQTKVQSITSSVVQSVSQNNSMVNSIAKTTQLPQTSVQTVFNSFTQNMNLPTNEIITNIAQQTNIPKEKVTQILQQMSHVISQSTITKSISDKEQVSSKTILDVIQSLTNPVHEVSTQPASAQVAQVSNIPSQTVSTVTIGTLTFIANNPSRMQYVQNQTGIDAKQAQIAITVLTQNLDKPMPGILAQLSEQSGLTISKTGEVVEEFSKIIDSKKTLESIAQSTKTDEQTVEKVMKSITDVAHEAVASSVPMTQTVARETNIAEKQAQSIISSVISNAVKNDSLLQNVKDQTGANENQVKKMLMAYAQNVSQPSSTLVDRVAQASGIERQKVVPVLRAAMKSIHGNIANSKDIIKKIAEKEGVTENQASEVFEAQVPMVTESADNVEKSVAIPAGVSIEDYEEVKKMWTEQYEKGEVPTDDNITSREQWVDQDTVMLSNVLNKFLSSDEKLRREALDDVGVLLPIFMVNNLTGEELLVYLKAKLEAAKSIKAAMIKERENENDTNEGDEEFVDITRDSSDSTPQTLHMEVEEASEKKQPKIEINNTVISTPDEVSESKLKDTLSAIPTDTTPQFTLKTEDIKGKKTNDLMRTLNMVAEKLSDIARIDTNRQTREIVAKHIKYLTDPSQAVTAAERQTYMDMKNELSARSVDDQTAGQLLSLKDHNLKNFPQAVPVSNAVAGFVKLSPEKIQTIISAVISAIAQNKNILNVINKNIQIPQDTIQNMLITFTHNMHIPANLIINTIGEQLDIPNEKVSHVFQEVNNDIQQSTILDLKDIIKKTAAIEKVTENQIKEVIAAQIITIIAPLANVENTIPMSANVSLEDYEEVKEMWAQQYENGEVPVGDTIESRENWISQDIILITNILNKLLSQDDKIRKEALDEVGFLLPIFMLNNLTGQELLLYLKAKLESAKTVLKQLKKETDLKDKLKLISTNEPEEVVVKKTVKTPGNTKEMKISEPEKNSK